MVLGKRRREYHDTVTRSLISKKTVLTCYFEILPLDVLIIILSVFGDTSDSDTEALYANWPHHARQWKTLMLVCRTWHETAIREFYRTIYLSRLEQIPLLIRTLENTVARERNAIVHNSRSFNEPMSSELCIGYGRWIRRICIRTNRSFQFACQWLQAFHQAMNHTLAYCPFLHSFAEKHAGGECPEAYLFSFLHLLNNSASAPFPHQYQSTLASFQRLSSLSIVLRKEIFIPNKTIFFPTLRALTCTVQPNALQTLRGLTDRWKLPNLIDLAIIYFEQSNVVDGHGAFVDASSLCEMIPGPPIASGNNVLRDFCLAHGSNIISFTFDNKSTDGNILLPGLFSNSGILPKLENLTYSYLNTQRLASTKPGEYNVVFDSLHRIYLLPEIEGHQNDPELTLSHLVTHLRDFIEPNWFPVLETIVLLSPSLDGFSITDKFTNRDGFGGNAGWVESMPSMNWVRELQKINVLFELGRRLRLLNRFGERIVFEPDPASS